MFNRSEIFGKAPNKLHIFLLFNETYEFVLILPVYIRLEANFVTESCREFFKYEWVMICDLVLTFNQFHRRKWLVSCVHRSKWNTHSERISFFWEIFKGFGSRDINHVRSTMDWTKLIKLRFRYWICFELDAFHWPATWHFHYILLTKQE